MRPGQIRLKDVEAPKLLFPTDALVKVTLTSICGTDLHPYRGQLPGFSAGTIMGHEFTGVVVAVGDAVAKHKVGQRVVASDLIACGTCWYCRRSLSYHCSSVSLFGYGQVVGSYTPGGQSELVRVPFADTTLFSIPDTVSDEEALFVGDILSTGYACIHKASLVEGDTVAVVGGGPVGLMAAMCARLLRPANVYVVEPNPKRQLVAREIGAIPLSPDEVEPLFESTHRRGADTVVEAVGSQEAFQLALRLVRPAGTVVCAGAHHSRAMPFDLEDAFARELSLRFVVGNPLAYGKQLLQLIEQGSLKPAKIITHRLPLAQVEQAYRLFAAQEALKVVLTP